MARILVVDDEPTIRHVMRLYLEMEGHEVSEAVDGQEALEFFKTEHERLDAVILDLSMPRLSGRECLQKMCDIDSGVPVVISSGSAALGPLDPRELQPAFAVLEKPFRLERFGEVIKRTLASRARST